MAISWAFPWNAPRPAIASPYLTHAELHRRNQLIAALLQARHALALQPECVRLPIMRTADTLEKHHGEARANATGCATLWRAHCPASTRSRSATN